MVTINCFYLLDANSERTFFFSEEIRKLFAKPHKLVGCICAQFLVHLFISCDEVLRFLVVHDGSLYMDPTCHTLVLKTH